MVKGKSGSNRGFAQDGLTVGHLQKGLTVGHLAQGLAGQAQGGDSASPAAPVADKTPPAQAPVEIPKKP
jgi:hypothetical protein